MKSTSWLETQPGERLLPATAPASVAPGKSPPSVSLSPVQHHVPSLQQHQHHATAQEAIPAASAVVQGLILTSATPVHI